MVCPFVGRGGRAATTPPAQSGRPESLPAPGRRPPARRSARCDGSQREPFHLEIFVFPGRQSWFAQAMNPMMPRRDFLKTATVSAAALGLAGSPLAAVEPFKRPGTPRLQLSLAAYSFRQFFKDGSDARTPEPPADKRIDLFQFIDYCADHGCAGTELTSYYFPKGVDAAYLLRLRRHAFLRGVAVSGTAVGNSFTYPNGEKRDTELAHVRKWVDQAAVLGAPHIRVFAGNL